MTLQRRVELLTAASYGTEEVAEILGVGRTKAGQMLRDIARDGGAIPGLPGRIRPDALWRALGSSLKEQVETFAASAELIAQRRRAVDAVVEMIRGRDDNKEERG